jgi:hypothetical protein
MTFAVLVYETAGWFEASDAVDQREAYWGACTAFGGALAQSGALRTGDAALTSPGSAPTRRMLGGALQVVDGPFSDRKEQLGGFFLIEAERLDGALALARQRPSLQEGMGSAEARSLLSQRWVCTPLGGGAAMAASFRGGAWLRGNPILFAGSLRPWPSAPFHLTPALCISSASAGSG